MARQPFAERLLAWFDRERRDLPWRRTSDPWAIWVSEVMLQQTRVETVREPFERFLRAFPTPADFARADDDALLHAWQGLGYYRRARMLRRGAQQVVEQHAGEIPRTSRALGELAGIGSYTRGAIASIAFDEAVCAVDGNVERVLARHRGIRDNVKAAAGHRAVHAAASEDLDAERPGDFNQALMELGALVCTPRSPVCRRCPVAEDCVAHSQGLTESLPVLPARRAAVRVQARCALIHVDDGDRVLATRLADGPNTGQVELPGPGLLEPCPTPGDLEAYLATELDLDVDVGPSIARVTHGITHHRITLDGHACRLRRSGEAGHRLSARLEDASVPWTTAMRKLAGRLAADSAGG